MSGVERLLDTEVQTTGRCAKQARGHYLERCTSVSKPTGLFNVLSG